MNFRKYLIVLMAVLLAVLAIQPALSADNLTDVVTGAKGTNVTRTVINYTADLETDLANKYYNYGVQSLNLGDYTNAVAFFNKALLENTTMVKKTDALLYLYQNKAYSEIQLQKYSDAVTTLDAGIALYPKDPMLWNNRGYALSLLNKQQDALAAYDTALSFDSNYTKAYLNKGDLLSQTGRYKEAIAAYTLANDTDPFNVAAYDGLVAAKKGEAASAQTTTILLIVALVVVAGIAVWYVKFRKPSEPETEERKKKSRKK